MKKTTATAAVTPLVTREEILAILKERQDRQPNLEDTMYGIRDELQLLAAACFGIAEMTTNGSEALSVMYDKLTNQAKLLERVVASWPRGTGFEKMKEPT